MRFFVSVFGLICACLFGLCFYLLHRRQKKKPSLGISSLFGTVKLAYSIDARISPLFSFAILCFLIALSGPSLWEKKEEKEGVRPTYGIAIYLLLDKSGSMGAEISTELPNGTFKTLPKIELLKQVTKAFILGDKQTHLTGRSQDLIGIIAFARAATDLSPLTLDRKRLIDQIDNLKVVEDPTEDGTSIGYAIYKAASLIHATQTYAKKTKEVETAYEIKNTIMILITDGFQDPSRLDLKNPLRTIDPLQAAAYAKENGIRLYIINLEPRFATEDAAPLRHVMEQAAEMTGGHFYLVKEGQTLSQIYGSIDQLEKSTTEEDFKEHPPIYTKKQLYPYFLIGGMAFLAGWIFLTVYSRRVP